MKNFISKIKQFWAISLVLIFATFTLIGCTEAENATTDIKTEADNFQIPRTLTIINTRTDKVQCILTGTFSLNMDEQDGQLEIVTKLGKDDYRRDLFHINDDTNYYVNNIDKEFEKQWSDFEFEIQTFNDLYPLESK